MAGAMHTKAIRRRVVTSSKVRPSRTHVVQCKGYVGPGFTVRTFNAISDKGLNRFPENKYEVNGDGEALSAPAMAIMLRSHKLQEEEVPQTCRCIARCGAGTNNIPVARMTELGIPVFNSPGANANAVKECVVAGLLLASRGIHEGISHVAGVILPEEKDHDKVAVRIEKDKKMFGGVELTGKTLGVVGLGQIGGRVTEVALALGMHVVGYDPALSLDAALKLPGDRMTKVDSLEELLAASDYVTLHVPYIPGVTHHLLNEETLALCKPDVHLLNFARGEIVNGAALKEKYDSGAMTGKYISDFSDADLNGHPRHIVLPHLGASTEEAEENSAVMAAETIQDFLETGSIRNSVNFPVCLPGPPGADTKARLCIVHKNIPGILGQLTTFLGSKELNITKQINASKGEVAYTVIDLQSQPEDPDALQQELEAVSDGVLSSRFIGTIFEDTMGQPGTYFKVYAS